MKRQITFLIAMFTLAPMGDAFAVQASGTITAISKNADTITLSDGKTYTLPEGIEDTNLHVGVKIQLTYSTRGGKAVVSGVTSRKK